MINYFIVCPLVFLAGLMDAIAGGGGLISLPAYLLAGLPPHIALGTNKLSSSMGTTISTARFARSGYIKSRLALGGSVTALIGSIAGANLSLLLPGWVIERIMIVVLPVTAFYVLRNKSMGEENQENSYPAKTIFFIVLTAAFLIGMYDGFYGPGTGTFLLLIFTGLAKMKLTSASGLTKVINLSSNIAALLTFIWNGKVFYPLGITAGLFCIAGHYIGSGLVVSNGRKIVKPVVLLVLLILFMKILLERMGVSL